MKNSSPLKEIELSIEQATKLLEQGSALLRLRTNKDFTKLIYSGYFEQEAIRLVHLKADPNMSTDTSQKAIVSQMDAIGALNQYFNAVLHRYSMAEKAIEADQETRAELLAEEIS